MIEEAGFHEMEDAVLTDSDVDFHIRDILTSVSLVSLISICYTVIIWCYWPGCM